METWNDTHTHVIAQDLESTISPLERAGRCFQLAWRALTTNICREYLEDPSSKILFPQKLLEIEIPQQSCRNNHSWDPSSTASPDSQSRSMDTVLSQRFFYAGNHFQGFTHPKGPLRIYLLGSCVIPSASVQSCEPQVKTHYLASRDIKGSSKSKFFNPRTLLFIEDVPTIYFSKGAQPTSQPSDDLTMVY